MLDRQLISIAIWISGAIFGPWALTSALEGNPGLLLTFVVGVFLFLIIFVMKERAVVLPVMGISIGGKLTFMPFGLDTSAVFGLTLIFYYFFAYLAMKQRNITLGPRCLLFPICVITPIVLYHLHNLGLYGLMGGSGQEGSRAGVMMILGVVIYFCGISIASPPRKFLSKFPFYVFVLTILAQIPGIVSTIYPSTAPYLYYLTDNVNLDAYMQSAGYDIGMVRTRAFAGVGASLGLFLLCWYPVYTWWRPYRWWVPVLFLVSFALILPGGFRSDVVGFGIMGLLGLWCYFSWRTLFVLPVILAVAYALSLAVSSGIVPLSLQDQRGLSFLPGKWDDRAVGNAQSSLDFRNNIQRVYIREDLYKSPWIGTDYSFDRTQFQRLSELSLTQETPDGYYQAKSFIVGKMFHIGWISLYDSLGLIGGAAFLAMTLAMVTIVTYFILGPHNPADELRPLKIWLFCIIWGQAIGFFALFGDARSTFFAMCAQSIILVHLCRLELGWGTQVEDVPPPKDREREAIALTGKADPAPVPLPS